MALRIYANEVDEGTMLYVQIEHMDVEDGPSHLDPRQAVNGKCYWHYETVAERLVPTEDVEDLGWRRATYRGLTKMLEDAAGKWEVWA